MPERGGRLAGRNRVLEGAACLQTRFELGSLGWVPRHNLCIVATRLFPSQVLLRVVIAQSRALYYSKS